MHEYNSLVSPLDVAPLVIEGPNGDKVAVLDEALFKPIISGTWKGEDARDVLREAIDWWKSELHKIDVAVASNRN